MKGCHVCLASKETCHNPYGDLQLLSILMHKWKNLLINFVTGLPVSIDWKRDSYNSILVILDWLTKMLQYKLVIITLNIRGLTKVIINAVVHYHGLPDSIVINKGSFFTSKFWSLFCYFLGIKQRLFTAFHPQTDGQIEQQNNIIEAYLRAFVNFEQNDWARLLPMAKFVRTTQRTWAPAIRFLSYIAAIILAFLLRKKPIFAPNQNQ